MMGNEWKRLASKSALYLLMVMFFPIVFISAYLIKGKEIDGLFEIATFFTTQGWGIVTIMVAIFLGSKFFLAEHRGAWEYLATLPHSGMHLVWLKLRPRLIILILWLIGFWLLSLLPMRFIEGLEAVLDFTSPLFKTLPVVILAIFWLFYSGLLGIIPENSHFKRELLGWFGMASIFLLVWILNSLSSPGGLGLFRLQKMAIREMIGAEGILRSGLFALIGMLPLFWGGFRALSPITVKSPERFVKFYMRYALPSYGFIWIWFFITLWTGGLSW